MPKDHRVVDGKRWYIVRKGLTKAEAIRSANWQRKGKMTARIYKVSRGNYEVLTR